VANTAAKFGLRGAEPALRKSFQREGIGFTVSNPDNVATPKVLQDFEKGRFPPSPSVTSSLPLTGSPAFQGM